MVCDFATNYTKIIVVHMYANQKQTLLTYEIAHSLYQWQLTLVDTFKIDWTDLK